MVKRKVKPVLSRSFYIIEASSYHGGFSAFMTKHMAEMDAAISMSEFPGMYGWEWGGGDGYATPITLSVVPA